jgi:HEPN domain-containing protein
MTPEELLSEAKRWLAIAARDLHAARLLVTEEPSAAVFHCQQAAEKSAKAFLTFHAVSFRRTHDLNELGMQCSALNVGLSPLLQQAAGLTDYAVLFRYFDAPREPDKAEAAIALAIAQQVYDTICELVWPRETTKS